MIAIFVIVGVESAPVSTMPWLLNSRIRDREETLAFAVRSIYPVWKVVTVRVTPPFERQALLLEHFGYDSS